ncbi:hypothetical protein GGS26DRAFT_550171 [Hypomontagnella submonticulosa]|nr:hypothetical protein GGS26DRAFT_550171 [Hypomontagnella submonticulosa]
MMLLPTSTLLLPFEMVRASRIFNHLSLVAVREYEPSVAGSHLFDDHVMMLVRFKCSNVAVNFILEIIRLGS